jgi:hypothetical protein
MKEVAEQKRAKRNKDTRENQENSKPNPDSSQKWKR